MSGRSAEGPLPAPSGDDGALARAKDRALSPAVQQELRDRRAAAFAGNPPAPAPSGAGAAGQQHRPGRPAEQVIADAISSVLVLPPETLGPLAERVADALGLPWPSGGRPRPRSGHRPAGAVVTASQPAVPDELVERACRAWDDHDQPHSRENMRAALAAVLPDVEARVRRECAEELRAEIDRQRPAWSTAYRRLPALADSWEQQRGRPGPHT